MTLTTYHPLRDTRSGPEHTERDAFDEAFRALLRAWHDYEVLRALGAPLDTVSAARGALQRARGEVTRRRLSSTC
jgi:hypothetical protein